MNTTRRFEYVSDKYGQGGGKLNWFESVAEFEECMRGCGMPCELTLCGEQQDGWGYQDQDGDLILIEHEP